jgi:organic hydroperoxide reductase OsmC/OhrA
MPNGTHEYTAHLAWTGNRGAGTPTYDGYGRSYRVTIDGKPELLMSADAAFRGDGSMYNPEDLFLASISGCHMLSYLALCARRGVSVISYEDHSSGILRLEGGGGSFEQVTIAPIVTIADGGQTMLATELHDRAAECCFIGNSCRVPIHHRPTIRVLEPSRNA